MAVMTIPIRIAEAMLVDLVTYRKDGRPVHTPVLSTPRDGDLLIQTQHTAGKLKRLRHNPAVEVTPCDGRGRHLGEVERGTARILDSAETRQCQSLLLRRHGLVGRGSTLLRRLRGQIVFIEVRVA
jgi:uncharacterized protein